MQLTRGVWQMSLAMIISGSIGAFVLLSGLPVTDVVFWRCLIGALTLLVFIVLSRQPFSRLTRFTLALAVIGGAALVVNWLLLFAAAGNNLGWGEKKPRRGGVSEQSRAS